MAVDINEIKVLMIEPNWHGGLALYSSDLSASLAQQGVCVELLVPTRYQFSASGTGLKIIKRLWPLDTQRRYYTRLHWMVDKTVRISHNHFVRKRFVSRGEYNIVHFQSFIPAVGQYLLRGLANAKKTHLVYTAHDTVPHGKNPAHSVCARRRAFALFDMIITHYDKGKDNLINLYGVPEEKIEVIPHGLRLKQAVVSQGRARQCLEIPEDRKVLLFFGAIRDDKGLDILLQSVAAIKEQVPELLLVIAGRAHRQNGFKKYDELIESLNIHRHIFKRLGFIPEEQLSSYFSAADVCVLPYKEFESQSGVLMQAYAHYKPAVVTDAGAMAQLVRSDGTGIVVKPNDGHSLADGIIRFFQNRQKYEQNCGRKTAEKYCWSRTAAMTIDCYQKFPD